MSKAVELFYGNKVTAFRNGYGLSATNREKEGTLGSRGVPSEDKQNTREFKKDIVEPNNKYLYATPDKMIVKDGVPVIANLTIYDPKSQKFQTFENVPLYKIPGTTDNGMPESVMVEILDPIGFSRNSPTSIRVTPAAVNQPIVNKTLPQEVKIKPSADPFSGSTSSKNKDACAATKMFGQSVSYMEAQAKALSGDISDRNDLKVFQGKGNRSPSVIVHEEDGAIYMSDSTGKQSMKMSKGASSFNSADFDVGTASRSRNIVMQENPVRDTLPTGTILTPQPVLIPHFAKLMNTVLTIMDMVDLVRAMANAVKIIKEEHDAGGATDKSNEDRAELSKTVNTDRTDQLAKSWNKAE